MTPALPDEPHPHAQRAPLPVRLDPARLRQLSSLDTGEAVGAIVTEWATIAGAIAVASLAQWWPLTLVCIVLIGARQHALLVLAHDASHFRLLANRKANDWVGNLLLAWPMFISVEGFRHFHGDHHRFLQSEGDGNRVLWGTHDASGQLVPEWRYPKSPLGLVAKVLRRASGFTGLYWIARGLLGGFMFGAPPAAQAVRALLAILGIAALSVLSLWAEFFVFWVVPYCTWHVGAQYVRLVCEHSAVRSGDPRYGDTRSTLPGPLGRLLVLPRNIGYHLAHHWYPSVPFYRLPELQAALEQEPGFLEHARCNRSILASLRDVTTPEADSTINGKPEGAS